MSVNIAILIAKNTDFQILVFNHVSFTSLLDHLGAKIKFLSDYHLKPSSKLCIEHAKLKFKKVVITLLSIVQWLQLLHVF